MADRQPSILSKYAHILHAPDDPPPFPGEEEEENEIIAGEDSANTADNNKPGEDDDGNDTDDAAAHANAKSTFQPRTDEEVFAFNEAVVEVSMSNLKEGVVSESLIISWPNEISRVLPSKSVNDTVKFSGATNTATSTPAVAESVTTHERKLGKNPHDVGDYDYDDPFIDDDDDYFAEQLMFKPTIEGYFVWKGPVPSVEVDPLEDEMSTSTEMEDRGIDAMESEGGIENSESPDKQQISDDEKRKSDLENQKAHEEVNSTNVSPVKNTPKKKRTTLPKIDGLIVRKKKRKVSTSGNPPTVSAILQDNETTSSAEPVSNQNEITASQTQPEGNEESPAKERKPRIKKPLKSLPDASSNALQVIKELAEKTEFKKGKFPSTLKDPLIAFIKVAVSELDGKYEKLHGDEGKLYWSHLKEFLPFQSSTLKKMIDKQVLAVDVEEADKKLTELYQTSQVLVKECVEKSMKSFENKLEKWKNDHPTVEIDEDGKIVETTAIEKEETIDVVKEDSPESTPLPSLPTFTNANISPMLPSINSLSPSLDPRVFMPPTAVNLPINISGIIAPILMKPPVIISSEEVKPIESTASNPEQTTITTTTEPAITNSQPPASQTKKPNPPSKKLIWTPELRNNIYKIVTMEHDLIPMKRRLKEIGVDTKPVAFERTDESQLATFFIPLFSTISLPEASKTDLVIRKAIYQHLLQYLFIPAGAGPFVTTTEIGRQYNSVKSKEEPKKEPGAPKSASGSLQNTPSKPKKEKKPRAKKEANEGNITKAENNQMDGGEEAAVVVTPVKSSQPPIFPHNLIKSLAQQPADPMDVDPHADSNAENMISSNNENDNN